MNNHDKANTDTAAMGPGEGLFEKPKKVAAPGSLLSLNVIDGADKIDELKRAFEADAAAGKSRPKPATDVAAKVPVEGLGGDDQLREKVIDVLRTIYDPELPVNIYDLGLIYDIELKAEGHEGEHGGTKVHVKMTLTAPGCPVAGTLPPAVARKIEGLDEVSEATVELVWEPAWSKDRLSEAALLDLGLI